MYCNEFACMRKSENKITLYSTGNCINQIIYNEHDCNIRHAEKSETRSPRVTIHYKCVFLMMFFTISKTQTINILKRISRYEKFFRYFSTNNSINYQIPHIFVD